ncbi:MAG: sulfatase [Bacteroidales bacterium]
MRKGFSTLVFGFILAASIRAQEKPNIVMIFIDDWAWAGTPIKMDESMANSMMPLLQMPNLEKFANEGMKFRNAYSAAPQCSPSRVALQTGQSSPRNGFTVYMNSGDSDYYDLDPDYSKFPVIPCVSDMTIDEDAVTIPESLKPLGYASAHFGKWHMRGHPDDEGYIANDGPTTNKEGNSRIADDPKLMFSVTKKGIEFMEDQVKARKPFYLQLSHYAMHNGLECLPETREKYTKAPEIQAYYKKVGATAETINRTHRDPASWLGMGEDLDGRIGAVLDKIKELGIEDNTYVVIAADNGYRHFFYSALGRTQPLHSGKWWVWQGGIRVSMFAKGPGIEPGSVCNENVVNFDFLPTFVEWAGGKPKELKDIDGESLAGLMAGKKVSKKFSERNLYFHYPHYRNSMPTSVIVSGTKKVIHFYEAPDVPMLFDLAEDEGEVKNIAKEYPGVHQKLYNQMMSYLEAVGARIPKMNPDYDEKEYNKARFSDDRIKWGPFEGERPLEEDEVL